MSVSLAASASQPTDMAQKAWGLALAARIEANWKRSSLEEPSNYPCKIRIFIDRSSGDVVAAVPPKPCSASGDVERSIIKAVNASSPLPLPSDPETFVPVVTISFRPPQRES
jgi:hypothetical protein